MKDGKKKKKKVAIEYCMCIWYKEMVENTRSVIQKHSQWANKPESSQV